MTTMASANSDVRLALVLACVAACILVCLPAAFAGQDIDWQWKDGRATFYGTDDWSIHKGSCNYGYLFRDEPHGWDVAAMTDYYPAYPDSCGTCYELACSKTWIHDNYGQSLDRTYSCYNDQQSVVVRITDTCPCTYPANAYSNKRWCCGDMDHFDASIWALEKLADTKWGVIGIKYRRVPCDYTPQQQAPEPANPTPGLPAPWGASKPTRDWPEYNGNPSPNVAVMHGIQSGWWDNSRDTWTQPAGDAAKSGMRSGQGYCASIHNGGAISFKTNPGAFNGRYKLQFWIYVGVTGWEGTSAQVPDITINIAGSKGECNVRRIFDVKPDAFEPMSQYSPAYYWRWEFYLPAFAGADTQTDYNSPSSFSGCGGNGVGDLTTLEFRHDGFGGQGDKWVCIDHVQLL